MQTRIQQKPYSHYPSDKKIALSLHPTFLDNRRDSDDNLDIPDEHHFNKIHNRESPSNQRQNVKDNKSWLLNHEQIKAISIEIDNSRKIWKFLLYNLLKMVLENS